MRIFASQNKNRAASTAMLVLASFLTGCFDPGRPILAEALGALDVPAQETDNLQLKGIELGNDTGVGLTREQGEALFRFHQGKPANARGILEKITVNGNTADIEIYPVRIAFAIRDCNLIRGNTAASGCHVQNRSFVSTTCRVKDWASLNQKTGGNMLAALQLRRTDRKNRKAWPFMHLEGTLANFQQASKTILIHTSGNNFDFGALPGTRGATATYETFLVRDCNVRGYDFKLVR